MPTSFLQHLENDQILQLRHWQTGYFSHKIRLPLGTTNDADRHGDAGRQNQDLSTLTSPDLNFSVDETGDEQPSNITLDAHATYLGACSTSKWFWHGQATLFWLAPAACRFEHSLANSNPVVVSTKTKLQSHLFQSQDKTSAQHCQRRHNTNLPAWQI